MSFPLSSDTGIKETEDDDGRAAGITSRGIGEVERWYLAASLTPSRRATSEVNSAPTAQKIHARKLLTMIKA